MECDYCGEEVPRARGKMLVLQSGEKLFFCSGKCEKNHRNNRNLGYTNGEEE